MSPEDNSHRKVRFRREDRQDLNRLPSASKHQKRQLVGHGFKIVHVFSKAILLVFAALVVIVGIFAAVLATTGISNRQFAGFAQDSLQRLTGPDLVSEIGDAGLSLDRTGNLAFQANNVIFSSAAGNAEIANIGSLKMGLKALPLLLGKIEVDRVEVNNVTLAGTGDPGQANAWVEKLKRSDGLYDPGALPAIVHQMSNEAYRQFKDKRVSEILVTNLKFSRPLSAGTPAPVIHELTLVDNPNDSISVTGKVTQSNQNLELAGQIASGSFDLDLAGLSFGVPTSKQVPEDTDGSKEPIAVNGDVDLKVRGLMVEGAPALQYDIGLERFDYRNLRGARIAGVGNIRAELIENVDKVEIKSAKFDVGSNQFNFTGAVGPEVAAAGSVANYRFELVSTTASLSPKDSPENRLSASVRLAGTVKPASKEVNFSQIGLRTLSGQLYGQGSVTFGEGSPEMIFALKIPEITVPDAKQLWPSIFAGGARLWVLDHVYGGTITDSSIDISYGAGSIKPRTPNTPMPLPTSDQVSADFNINNARFDVMGDLPAVRDASGTVTQRGANTLIQISRGVAYL
ncbi:MAG: hypothetical protein ACRCU5_11340, partial [Rhizobiaceae bacterium]